MNPQFSNFLGAAPDHYSVLGWIVLLPLLGALINGFGGRILGRQAVYITGVATVATSFVLSCVAFYALVRAGAHDAAAQAAEAAGHAAHGASAEAHHGGPTARLTYLAWNWFRAPALGMVQLNVRYSLDALSGVMLLVVTGVGSLVHLYSTGYMSHDEGFAKYFAFLNLFLFSMLNLILGDSMVLLFVGWEGVGLCSYLLIGFWFQNPEYAAAGKKAFIVNRIGDVGVIIGMSILAAKGGHYEFSALRDSMTAENSDALRALSQRVGFADFVAWALSFGSSGLYDWLLAHLPQFSWGGLACIALFLGCTGKSAQLPLFVWLPDAMAGPTPVSALIHAATMVTAGVYLLCRLSFVYVHFPSVLAVISVVGGLTALIAATIALTQTELKKVLAYSTVSQLGFMFMACGQGAFSAGLFHVYTHAMFKACLFLGAGAVMHACRDSQDLRKLGGLRKYLPYTFWTFAIATLAIIGTPGFSGFFSKDEILFRALTAESGMSTRVGTFTFVLGWTTAVLTAFYMSRLTLLTFWGDFKGWSLNKEDYEGKEAAHDDHGHGHGHGEGNPWDPPKENPWTMTAPLVVLAFMSVVAGYIGLPKLFTGHHGPLPSFLSGVVSELPTVWGADEAARTASEHAEHGNELLSMGLGVLAFALGAGGAWWVYVTQKGEPAQRAADAAGGFYRLLLDKWRFDELYDLLVVRPLRFFSDLASAFDRYVIDGIVKLVGLLPLGVGRLVRLFQTGSVHMYGMALSVGMALVLLWAVWVPSATIGYRAQGTQLTLQAHGGPGYSYQWDLSGSGTFDGAPTLETRQTVNCHPVEGRDGRNYCRVGLRVRNAFGREATVTRTIAVEQSSAEETH